MKGLLSGDLPLEYVGQRLRETARRAVLSGDRRRMTRAAGLVLEELRRRGEITPVTVKGTGEPRSGLFFLRGRRRLLDLGHLSTSPEIVEGVDTGDSGRPATQESSYTLDMVGLLDAMEEAQNLEIGDPGSGEIGVILAGILRLLARFTPDLRLFALLLDDVELPEDNLSLIAPRPDEPGLGWLEIRQTGTSAWMPDPSGLPPVVNRATGDFIPACAAAVPLREPGEDGGSDGQEIGVLLVAADRIRDRDALLQTAAHLSRFVTRRWRQQLAVNQRIHTDSLTGVHNRAYFDSQFTLELERARRSGIPLTLILGDIDHFKAVNDRYGHQAGDEVLVAVARRLQEELRRIDHVCRIGGEEFALILPDTSREAAHDVMKRLLDEAFSATAGDEGQEMHITVTVSYGSVTFPDDGVDAFELYRKADAMLYLSKDSGRHRCHSWNASGDHIELLPGSETTS